MNIYQKLIEVRKVVPYLRKEAEGAQYQYVGSSQVLGAVVQKMNELGLLLIPRVVSHNVLYETVENTDKYNKLKKTTTYFTELDIEFTWVNAENPEEKIIVPFYAQGVDIAGEKGVGKALTYAEKYFLLKQFNIATDHDDPDAFEEKAERNRRNPANEEHINLLEKYAKEYCEIKGEGTPESLFAGMGIDLNSITAKEASRKITTLKSHVDKARKAKGANNGTK